MIHKRSSQQSSIINNAVTEADDISTHIHDCADMYVCTCLSSGRCGEDDRIINKLSLEHF